jgi:hypothetical protein
MSTMLETPTRGDFEAALGSDTPLESLRAAVWRLIASGSPRTRVLALLDEFREGLRVAHRDEAEDVVIEVMAHLDGWTSSNLAL